VADIPDAGDMLSLCDPADAQPAAARTLRARIAADRGRGNAREPASGEPLSDRGAEDMEDVDGVKG
jgi:hypothetical protein